MKKSLLTFGMFAICISLFAQPDFGLETFATGFSRLVDITNCGDDRLFVVEKDGRIRIIEADGTVLSTPFLDIDPRVKSGGELGLLGLAFHPDYLENGYFYVYYTDNGEDTQVSRFSVSDVDPNLADPDSELKMLDANQPYSNHNGGCMKFGPDGYLYISLGDGGSGGDPQGFGQNRLSFLGKMLRIDVDNGEPYTIPSDNPFADDDFTLDEIWALGLRNVWRFSFDAVTGDMWLGDVGQSSWEEIDFQPASSTGGENYGWRCYEGNADFEIDNDCEPKSSMTFPVFEYENTQFGDCSVTGGFVYRGCELKGLYGHYIFGDYCSGQFWSITPDGAEWNAVEIGDLNVSCSSFGEDAKGELYVVDHPFNASSTVFKIVSSSGMLKGTDETVTGASDGTITYTIPIDQIVQAEWNDGSTDIERNGLAPGVYSVEVTTSNGCVFNEEIEIREGTVAIYEQMGLLLATITPNPFEGAFKLQLNAPIPLDVEVIISNANGKSIQTETLTIKGFFEKTYRLQDAPPGIYYFTLKNEKGEWSEQVVKK